MSSHQAILAQPRSRPPAIDPGRHARQRFFDTLDSTVRDAQACAQRIGVYLVGVERPRQLEEGIIERAHARLAHCLDGDARVALLRDDTIGVMVPQLQSGLRARETAVRILGTLGYPMRTSIGISLFPCDGREASELLCCAAWALARARRQPRATYCFYLRAFATSAASSSPLL